MAEEWRTKGFGEPVDVDYGEDADALIFYVDHEAWVWVRVQIVWLWVKKYVLRREL